MIREIKDGELFIARYIPVDAHKTGLNFFSKDEEFVQVGSWYKYPEGKYLNKHFHNELDRINTITQEVFFVVQGKVKTSMYNKEFELVDELILHKGDILIFFEGGHDFTILEDDTIVYEVKNGPYLGADKDKTKF
jgi:hypothetical protein